MRPTRTDLLRRSSAAAPKGSPSTWLLGTWKSDKEATVAAWGENPPGSKNFQAFLLEGLGKLTQRYTVRRSYAKYEDNESSSPYRVLWENKDSLLLVYGTKKDERGIHITFASPDQYWVHVGRYIEYFTRQSDA
jgi:hypothetical protein